MISTHLDKSSIAGVCDHVRLHSNLADDVVRLLEHMLRVFSPMRGYRSSRIGGLPQEPFDCSRILAHTYLLPLDAEFETEGREKRYSRWVDDVVVGAKSYDEALQQVARAQQVLEPLALYPNAAKTRIIPSEAFVHDYMKSENDYLGECEDAVESGLITRASYRVRVERHMRLKSRPKAWGRVLRRYYTVSRHIRDDYLMGWWTDHLVQSPESAAHILEYAQTYGLNRGRFDKLQRALETFAGVYEDLDILSLEYLNLAPNRNSVALRSEIARWALSVVATTASTHPRVAATAAVTAGKHGTMADLEALLDMYSSSLTGDSPVRQQAMVVLFGAGLIDDQAVRDNLARSSIAAVQHAEFLLAVSRGDEAAVGVAIGLIQPSQRQRPERWSFRPRSLFLAPLVRRAASKRWGVASATWRKQIAKDAPFLRDRSAERWVFARNSVVP